MIFEVVVDISNDHVDKTFDYISDTDIPIGSRVMVPFGGRNIQGIVFDKKNSTDFDIKKLKHITKVLDSSPSISEEFLSLSKYLVDKFFLRKNDIFKLMLPSEVRYDKSKLKQISLISVNSKLDISQSLALVSQRSKKQIELIHYIYEIGEQKLSLLLKIFNRTIIDSVVEKGALIKKYKTISYFLDDDFNDNKNVKLTEEQKNAVNSIMSAKGIYLLHGITGSGKTEIYLSVIEKMLEGGKTAIMLVPEISLTPQMLSRFKSRFGNKVAVLHSKLSTGERFEEWTRLKNGEATVAIGARSAIFAPLKNIGVIIIDEEHDNSYTSENNPRYETIEVAKFRANYNNCSLILGSATPKIESYNKAKNGEYSLIKLKNRIGSATLPEIQIVDMVGQMLDGNSSCFSSPLLSELKKCIANKKQAMLFVNRRGYASFMMCRECGYVAKCSDCEVALVYHKEDEELKCHYCGKRYHALTNCPNCHSKYIRYGATGTQKIVEELKQIFPDTAIFRMDNDTTRTKDAHKKILTAFGKTKPAILVGTQMIAKGHDFEDVSLVGIIDADVSLYTNDYRATETTFQLVTQVAGRAGRKDDEGKVILQTYSPKHYVYRLARAYDYEKFFEHEINVRATTNFPPFSNIIRILVTSENDELAKSTIKQMLDPLLELRKKYGKDIYLLQAMPSPIKRIQRKFRYQILVRYALKDDITFEIHKICDIIPNGKVSIFIENNPHNLR